MYFSCSITGGRNDQNTYQHIVHHLQERGLVVLTAHLAEERFLEEGEKIDAHTTYQRDIAWLKDSAALFAEVSTPSHGVGYEIAMAEILHKPIFCCYQRGKKVSKIILGNENPFFFIYAYSGIDDLLINLDKFLNDLVNGTKVIERI